MTPTTTFKTQDLYLAAALKLIGFKLVDTEKNDRGRGVFVFQDREDRPATVRDYYAGNLQGSLKGFSNAWTDLKTLIEIGIEKANVRTIR